MRLKGKLEKHRKKQRSEWNRWIWHGEPMASLIMLKVKVTQSCLTLCDPMNYTVQGILQARTLEWVAFPFSMGSSQPQGSNPGLLHCRRILYQLSHQGSPRILEWVAYPFSRESSQPRNRTRVPLHCRWILYQPSFQGRPVSLLNPSIVSFASRMNLDANLDLASPSTLICFWFILTLTKNDQLLKFLLFTTFFFNDFCMNLIFCPQVFSLC